MTLFFCAPGASAQSKPAGVLVDIDLAATERTLWLSESTGEFTTILQRDGGGEFDLGRGLERPIERLLAADDDDVLAILRDGEIYRFRRAVAEATRERNLPVGGRALDLTVHDDRVYGVFAAPVFDALAAVETDVDTVSPGTPTSRPSIGPADAPGIAVFDGRDWRALLRCPPGVPEAGLSRVALLIQRERVLLAWIDRRDMLHAASASLGGETGWRVMALPPSSAGSVALAEANHTPVLIALTGADSLAAWRLLGQGDNEDWRRGDLQLSPINGETKELKYARVVGFGQHLALLCSDGTNAFVRFARVGEAPTLGTLSIQEVFARRGSVTRTQQLVQIGTYTVLLGLMVLLLVFRRDSMLRPAVTPPGAALAFTFQRAGALAIDFLPITLICAVALGLPWFEAWNTLIRWGLNPDSANPLPPTPILTWWVVSVFALAAYTALLESIWSRTIGKRLLGLRVLSERGDTAAPWQRVVRNLLRLLELMPHFWIFALLTLVSPNRQRLGDIIARTIVVRPVDNSSKDEGGSTGEADRN